MKSKGKIGYQWQENGLVRYLHLKPLEQPSERDWVDAVKRILDDYEFDSIFIIIDIVGFAPVLTKTSFDEMIKHLQERGLRKSTVAVTLDSPYYEGVARMFEASSGGYGFDLTMGAFLALPDAVRWLNAQSARD